MPTFVYFILIYLLVLLIACLVFVLVSKGLSLFYDVKMHQAKSLSHPIIKGLAVLLAVYTSRNFFAGPIIISAIQYLNGKYDLKIPIPNLEQTTAGTVEAIVLYTIVGLITVAYIFTAYAKKEVLREEQKEKEEQKQPLKIEFPNDPLPPSPIFHERIKRLFELKYEKENLVLQYDKEVKVLYGVHTYGLHNYCKIIYCDEGIHAKIVSAQEIQAVFTKLVQLTKSHGFGNNNEIVEYYYLLENGFFQKDTLSILCISEDTFLNNLIDFRRYLNKLIHNFQNDKLPFSYADIDEEKYSLGQTFIPPKFTVSGNAFPDPLETYINKWLTQNNYKHLVVLGDYGMGKSTFMKYYAFSLASQILKYDQFVRYPVFISLTNNSPRHGGIDNAIGKFVADNLGVNRELFTELVNRGKIVFLLDGFDEMGYVGTHDQRIKQLNAIWQLATKNNKLIISGRPSYFPTDAELIESFNIIKEEELLAPVNKPFFERIEIDEFDDDQIIKSIKIYNYTEVEKEQYIDFIFKSESIVDLCRRPSMMHIIREMLPKLFNEHQTQNLNASNLMFQYIDHWIMRQLDKNIISTIEDKKQKKHFVWSVFTELACDYYLKGVEKQSAAEVLTSVKNKILELNLTDKNEIEGLETEILSGFFIEIEDGGYKFVHKSFKEFFIAKGIISLIETKEFKHPLFTTIVWNKEINDFIYDHFNVKDEQSIFIHNNLPFLYDRFPAPVFTKRRYLKFFLKVCKVKYKLGSEISASSRVMLNLSYIYFLIAFQFYDRRFLSGMISFMRYNSNSWENTIVNFIVKGLYYSMLRSPDLYIDETVFRFAILNRLFGYSAALDKLREKALSKKDVKLYLEIMRKIIPLK